ncbi:MAG: hypothetical protein GF400_04275 [Candidatus Eisenbacteria bacterium]|nr:hypothetical protein [Candidatus Eisenbacteria bacterium]
MRARSARGARRWHNLLLAAALALGLLVGSLADVSAAEPTFPRLANVYFNTLVGADLEAVARYDLIVIPKHAQTWYQNELSTLRELNPDMRILVHMPVGYDGAWNAPEDNAILTEKFDSCGWWLRDTVGEKVIMGERSGLLNMTADCPPDSEGKRLTDWLPEYMAERLGPGGYWDGIFMDFCMYQISWANDHIAYPIDTDQDGIPEGRDELDQAWDQGMRAMVERTRELVGDDYILVSNGNNTYYDVCDGSTREDFPRMHGDWYQNVTHPEYGYLAMSNYKRPSSNLIITCWGGPATLGGPVETPEFRRKFGLTFASTLVFGDGYYALDSPSYSYVWWHRYFDLELGTALGRAEHVPAAFPGRGPGVEHADMLKMRRFDKGVAVVNPTNCDQSVVLPGLYFSPDSWNGEFYPRSAATSSVDVCERSGAVMVGTGRLLAMPAGLLGWRSDGVNHVQWPEVEGASGYSVYRVDVGGGQEDKTLLGVFAECSLEDRAARTSVSRYFVAAIDEAGCEGQLSCPVEVSSGLGSDLSLALVAADEPDGTLTLSWTAEGRPDGCHFIIARVDEDGARRRLTGAPIEPRKSGRWAHTDRLPVRPVAYEAIAVKDGVFGNAIGSARAEDTSPAEDPIVLLGCHPHPMSSSTTFEFRVPRSSAPGPVRASLTIYDVAGRVVRRVCEGEFGGGTHSVPWDGRSRSGEPVASGCYFYALTAGEDVQSGKLLVVR